jgi:DNA-binding response OmpR family regulator
MAIKAKILYVEDDRDEREMIQYYLNGQGYEVQTAENFAEALQKAGEEPFDLFMLDLRLPDGLGADLALKIRQLQPTKPIVYYTASTFPEERLKTMSTCGEAFLIKPESCEDNE